MNIFAKLFIGASNMAESGKYNTLRSALGRRIKELDAQKIPLTVDNVSEKVLKSGMSMRALATRDIYKKDVLNEAQGMMNEHNNTHKVERHLSFK
jgi:hypothetical protein